MPDTQSPIQTISTSQQNRSDILDSENRYVSVKINQQFMLMNFERELKITPVQILKDNRCPELSVCIMAGSVQLKVQVIDPISGKTMEYELESGKEIVWPYAEKLSLWDVSPTRSEHRDIKPEEYVFHFRNTSIKPVPNPLPVEKMSFRKYLDDNLGKTVVLTGHLTSQNNESQITLQHNNEGRAEIATVYLQTESVLTKFMNENVVVYGTLTEEKRSVNTPPELRDTYSITNLSVGLYDDQQLVKNIAERKIEEKFKNLKRGKEKLYMINIIPVRNQEFIWSVLYDAPTSTDSQIQMLIDIRTGQIIDYQDEWA